MAQTSGSTNPALKVALLASAAVLLQGCVAAVVPLAATGLLGGAAPGYKGKDRPPVEAAAANPDGTVEVQTAPQQVAERTPAPEAQAIAEAAALAEADEPMDGEPGLGTDAVAELVPPAAAVEPPAPSPSANLSDQTEPAEALGTDDAAGQTVALSAPEPVNITGTLAPDALDDVETNADLAAQPAEIAAAASTPSVSASAPDIDAALDPAPLEATAELAPTPAPAPAQASTVQLLDVDRRVTFADPSIDASTVTSADMAAALRASPDDEEAVVDEAALARATPAPAPITISLVPAPDATSAPPSSGTTAVATAVLDPPAPTEPVQPAQPQAAAAPVAPPPASPADRASAFAPQPSPNAITSLLSYANQREFVLGDNRNSAMLEDRFSLIPKRAECGGVQPTVLIDLDPRGGLFAPNRAAIPPSGLGVGLAQLRASGVKIAWISGNPASTENDIRIALLRSALDIAGNDQVLLIAKDDDRKQTLREELAQSQCLIAIAGDERADFEELYDYLRDPSEAQALEVLYGEGWFLIPQPLVTESPNP